MRLSTLLETEYGDAKLILVKDPRMCRFFAIWEKALAALGVVPKVVIPVRHPLEVVGSLRKRDQMSSYHAKLLWLRHILDAEYSTRNAARVFIRYSDMLRDWQAQVEEVSIRLEIKWPRMSGSTKAEIDAYLAPELRHHTVTVGSTASSTGPRIASWVEAAYQAVGRLVDAPDQSDALATLDAIRQQFNETADIYAPVVQEQRMGYEEKIVRIGSENAELLHDLDELKSEHESLNLENRENYQKYTEAEHRASTLSKELHERESAKELLRIDLTERLRSKDGAFNAIVAKHEGLQTEVERLEKDREEMESNHRRALSRTVADLNEEIKRLQSACRQVDEVAHERHLEVAELTKLLLASEEKLAQEQALVREESARRNEQLEESLQTIHALQHASDDALRTIHVLEREIEEQRQLVVKYKSNLDRIHESRYWRLAAPVRRLGKAGKRPTGSNHEISDEEMIGQSGLFDKDWYLERYPDVRAGGINPVTHYLDHGAKEGRDPSAAFCTAGYLARYPDVLSSDFNPLVHYLKYGRSEGRVIFAEESGNEH